MLRFQRRSRTSTMTSQSHDVFDTQKRSCLSGLDLSRKGSIDAPILDLVSFINGHNNFFTTSSCSGRIIIVDNDPEGVVKKKGCKWLLTSHDCVHPDQVIESLGKSEGNAALKFEAFVMHVQCRKLENAQLMLSSGVGSGFRNSGLSVGNKGKFIAAIRSTQSLEVPLTSNGQLMVDRKYIEFIVDMANKKLADNLVKIERFFEDLKSAVHTDAARLSTQKGKQTTKTKKERKGVCIDDVKVKCSKDNPTQNDLCDKIDDGELENEEDIVNTAMFWCELDT
ncbi:tRNA wybutosine-synthesizing protein 3 homolog isoform X2 [Dreissena polymorpha]|uniref:tRNA wybutosine-synthesizing protein 3 homolog n=1 Tax=Dreissena polymorpha TaxID=45954 RepID=A0A9D4M034_DREPO|nr:tRNA wybutosine-synthesizing protein 3 homolog isoform X2 [Dreissena polymorpha]KAH3867139.1 hypothetical protein DPMN_030265 [Dreissena polymorpha]